MREILFRGKRKDSSEWVEGSLILTTSVKEKTYIVDSCYCYDGCIDEDGYADFDRLNAFEVIPKTVGQHTGLTDKNGKKIFEGDIIRYSDSGEYEMYLESLECPEEYDGINFENMWTIDEVVYGIAINYPAFDLNRHDWEVNGLSNLSESGCYFYEVIGNIHDNPELLKVGDENDT